MKQRMIASPHTCHHSSDGSSSISSGGQKLSTSTSTSSSISSPSSGFRFGRLPAAFSASTDFQNSASALTVEESACSETRVELGAALSTDRDGVAVASTCASGCSV